jgi:inhibitor of KinA sporulation pathway (predicted exonuclease)
MAKQDPNVLVLDVESTCWELPEVQGAHEISEIIEIGIAVVNVKTLKLVENSSIIVKPQKSKVSKFCTKLTTLTQNMVDQGVLFQDAVATLRRDYNSENRTFVSWGDYDRKMFERNCKDYGVKYPFGPRHLNLRNTFTMLHGLEREPGMDNALELLKMNLDGTHHRGIDDARNIGNIFIETLKKFRANEINMEMASELAWRHELDAQQLGHSQELEVQKNDLLKKIKAVAASNRKKCKSCQGPLSWTPSGFCCQDTNCREFRDDGTTS